MGEILCDRIGRVMVLTIANERKRNAIDHAMEGRLLGLLKEADKEDDVRVVVITGAGSVAFCSGHDLNELEKSTTDDPDPCGYPSDMRKPVIAAVNGHCHAAGLLLALSCDLRVASENAVFGQPGAKLGMLPVGRQIANLPRAMAPAFALEMMMTADPMPARRAYEIGFLNRLVPQNRSKDEALSIAARIAENSPSAVQAIKEGFLISRRDGPDAFDRFEMAKSETLKNGPDAVEGVRAFVQKRAPQF
jgi:enoyl-CoA hydratase